MELVSRLAEESDRDNSPDADFFNTDEQAMRAHFGYERSICDGFAEPDLGMEKGAYLGALAITFRHRGGSLSCRNMIGDLT